MTRSPRYLAIFLLAAAPAVTGCDQTETGQSARQARPALALAGRVTDQADILTPEQEQRLSTMSAAFETRTRHQMVVVSVTSLGGQDIVAFTRDLGNAWGIGRKGFDDGIILLVAPQERKARIAVGNGLEKDLPDAFCKEVIDAGMVPRFKAGDYFGGLHAGMRAIIAHFS